MNMSCFILPVILIINESNDYIEFIILLILFDSHYAWIPSQYPQPPRDTDNRQNGTRIMFINSTHRLHVNLDWCFRLITRHVPIDGNNTINI